MTEGSNYDYLFKVISFRSVSGLALIEVYTQQVVLIGDSGVGKSFVFIYSIYLHIT
jgi:serine kinase of HPr protein (carbohydrate metabolism regulator)